MSNLNNNFIRLNQDFFLDKSDIGKIISVIVDHGYYNKPKKYENCLLIELFYTNGLRPNEMTILYNNKVKSLKIENLKDIQVKFLS